MGKGLRLDFYIHQLDLQFILEVRVKRLKVAKPQRPKGMKVANQENVGHVTKPKTKSQTHPLKERTNQTQKKGLADPSKAQQDTRSNGGRQNLGKK